MKMVENDKANLSEVTNILVDAGYTGKNFATRIKAIIGATVETIKRSILLLYCQRDGLLSVLLLGWKSADDCGKIANVNLTPACKWLFLLSLFCS